MNVIVINKVLVAGEANMGNVGPALAPKGIKSMEFVKAFNDHEYSKEFKGEEVTAVITINPDKTFSFAIKPPSPSYLIKKMLNLKKGSRNPGKEIVATITRKQILEIAKIKQSQMPNSSLLAACRTIAGTAKSAGIAVEESWEELKDEIVDSTKAA